MSQKKQNKKLSPLQLLGVALVAVLLLIGQHFGLTPDDAADTGNTDDSGLTAVLDAFLPDSGSDVHSADSAPITAPQAIADYIFQHGRLPDNFITKQEAEALGWDSSENYVSDVAPGKSIGGDRFGNYEGLLPKASSRTWKEADANYVSGPRGAERIVYSNDGLVYYTDDHYESFTQMQPSK